MRSNPPTRRSRRSSNGDSSLPIIPILIGVIVLGFVIGAGLSLAGRHDMALVAVASPSPIPPAVTLAPVTPAPAEKPRPEPTDAPTAAPTAVPARTPTPAVPATPKAALRPHLRPPVMDAPARASAAPEAAQTAASPALAASPEAASPAASAPSAPSSPAESGTVADSAFAKLSADVVRQYLEAVKRGDQDDAYAALGAAPGAKGATLSEAAVIDSQTRVGHIEAHSAANDDALVSVELHTASGPYFAQYTVHKTETGAAVIVAHSIVKP